MIPLRKWEPLLLLPLMVAVSVVPERALAALKPLELRRHWVQRAQTRRTPPASKKDQVLEGPIEVSLILRNWYTELPREKRWTTAGAVRAETVVLVDLGGASLRFGWWDEEDFEGGTIVNTLKIWPKEGEKIVMSFREEKARAGHDMAESLQELHRQRDTGKLDASGENTLLTFDFAGRKLLVPEEEWTGGLKLAEDRQWLASVVDERLRESLEAIAILAAREPHLGGLCLLVIQPLLGSKDHECGADVGSAVTGKPGGKADCDFDGQFAEYCSLDQTLGLPRELSHSTPPTP